MGLPEWSPANSGSGRHTAASFRGPLVGEQRSGALFARDAKRPRGSTAKSNYTRAFLSRRHYSQDLLGAYLADSSVKEAATRQLLQSVSNQFPCNKVLFRNGDSSTPLCPLCTRSNPNSDQAESFGHIQCYCPTLAKPRTAVHHTIWRELLALVANHNKAVPGVHGHPASGGKWSFPTVVNSTMIKEWTIKDIANYILPDTFAAQQLDQLTTDLLHGRGLASSPAAVAKLLDKRPDGVAFLRPDKTGGSSPADPNQVYVLEFTKAADTMDDFQEQKEKKKVRTL